MLVSYRCASFSLVLSFSLALSPVLSFFLSPSSLLSLGPLNCAALSASGWRPHRDPLRCLLQRAGGHCRSQAQPRHRPDRLRQRWLHKVSLKERFSKERFSSVLQTEHDVFPFFLLKSFSCLNIYPSISSQHLSRLGGHNYSSRLGGHTYSSRLGIFNSI